MYGNKFEPPKRKPNRMQGYDYSLCGTYFITICTKDRAELFWEPSAVMNRIRCELSEYGKLVENAVKNICIHYPNISVVNYCIMPNHVHMVLFADSIKCGQNASTRTISTVIGQMKRMVSLQAGFPIWQKSFHDHIIRDKAEYEKIMRYIDNNPAEWEKDCYYISCGKPY